tara:strand:- start:169 stop:636 length:468 start_codon:yes stop_codon:yes gene_type:complete
MNGRTLEKMVQRFGGKVCSIVTSSMNRSFDEQISREHFVIRVEDIGADGIWGTHPYNQDVVSFFSMNHIISIHEEFELDPNNPEHAQMIKEYEEKTGEKLTGDIESKSTDLPIIDAPKETPPSDDEGGLTFVDIRSLEKLAEHSKKQFAAKDLLG